jgi:hypothetical protein
MFGAALPAAGFEKGNEKAYWMLAMSDCWTTIENQSGEPGTLVA